MIKCRITSSVFTLSLAVLLAFNILTPARTDNLPPVGLQTHPDLAKNVELCNVRAKALD